jgi:flagellar motor switch protein FliM
MEGPILDPQELEAIRNAIRAAGRAAPPQPEGGEGEDAIPIALIADDRAAERVRPTGNKIANRWTGVARTRLLRLMGVKLGFDVHSVEIIEGSSIRDELPLSWSCAVDAEGRPGAALVSVAGPIVEALAGCVLGAPLEDAVGEARAPSPTALRLFQPIGEVVALALAEVWREEQGCRVALRMEEDRVEATSRLLSDLEVVVAVTLAISGPTRGTARLIARPETLVMPATPVEAVPAPPGAIEEALGAVPIEVRVELGTAHMSMAEFSGLQPGAVLALDRFVDDPLPVRCAGVIKAVGKALVSRGVMAVEISGLAEGGAQ